MIDARSDERRSAIIAAGTLQGIDAIEVVDGDLPTASAWRQRVLVVFLFQPMNAGLSGVKVEVRGPESVGVMSAYRLDQVPATTDPDVQAALLGFHHPGLVLSTVGVVELDVAPGYGDWILAIVEPTGALLPGWDPVFACVRFDPKADCPTPLDCGLQPPCAPALVPPPRLDYLSRDFASLRRLLLDRLAITLPLWTDRNAADVGITLVEGIAYLGDRLAWRQDAIATEAYLGTARLRTSLRRHARLVDHRPAEAVSARTWLAVDAISSAILPAGTQVSTFLSDAGTVLDPGAPDVPGAAPSEVFQTAEDLQIEPGNNRMDVHSWGAISCLRAGATQLWIRQSVDGVQLSQGRVVILVAARDVDTGRPEDADPTLRHGVRLTATPTLQADPVTGEQALLLQWGLADALPFDLAIGDVVDGPSPGPLAQVLGNIVGADHGRSTTLEVEAPLVPDGHPPRIFLDVGPVAHTSAWDSELPASVSSEAAAMPALTVTSATTTWHAVPDLLASLADQPDVVVESDADGLATLRFGAHGQGMAPAPGTVLAVQLRIGGGVQGNVGPDTLVHVLSATAPHVALITNPLPAMGGMAPDSLTQIRSDAPAMFRQQERAVVPQDYEEVLERHPEVLTARVDPIWTGSWTTLRCAVDRVAGLQVDAVFAAELVDWLDRYRMMGRDVQIRPPVFAPLDLHFTVCLSRGSLAGPVLQALGRRFDRFDHPDGTQGFFHPNLWTFGRSLSLSELVSVIVELPGVDHVVLAPSAEAPMKFHRWGQAPAGEIYTGLIPIDTDEIARCDNDPAAPDNGVIQFSVRGAP